MTVWFTSDTHFRHKKVSESRGFDTPDEHDEQIIRNFNKVIRPDDILWILGDLGIAKTDWDILWQAVRLNGRKRLIAGNHDSVHPAHRNAHRHQRDWLTIFESVSPFGKASVCGTDFLLSHFPYEGDHGDRADRWTQFRLRDEGMPLLHGHLHTDVKLTSAVKRIVHVGLDSWDLKPVKDTDIKDLLDANS